MIHNEYDFRTGGAQTRNERRKIFFILDITYIRNDIEPDEFRFFFEIVECGHTPIAVDIDDADFLYAHIFFQNVPCKKRRFAVLPSHNAETPIAHTRIGRIRRRRRKLHDTGFIDDRSVCHAAAARKIAHNREDSVVVTELPREVGTFLLVAFRIFYNEI